MTSSANTESTSGPQRTAPSRPTSKARRLLSIVAVAAAQRLGEGGYRGTEATLRALLAEVVRASKRGPSRSPCARRSR